MYLKSKLDEDMTKGEFIDILRRMKKKGVWEMASVTLVQPSTDTHDDRRMLTCPVAAISSR